MAEAYKNSNVNDPNLEDSKIEEDRNFELIKPFPAPPMTNKKVIHLCLPFFLEKNDCEEIMASLDVEFTKSLSNISKSKVDILMLN
ncbi:unnamed protein product, partial [Hymenolepis diminuta]